MSRELQGLSAAPGTATGAPWRYGQLAGGPEDSSEEAPAARFQRAVATAEAELLSMAGELRAAERADHAEVLEAQALMARDPELVAAVLARVGSGESLPEAIAAVGEELAGTLAQLDEEIVAARATDVRDVATRIARAVTGARPAAPPADGGPWVLVADDLPPSAVLEMERNSIAGIALERGSPAAHLAILSRGLGIPVVVAVSGLLEAVRGARLVEVDASRGRVVIDPKVGHQSGIATSAEQPTAAVHAASSRMRDGVSVTLKANIDRPQDAEAAIRGGAAGIGLFRTEHLVVGGAIPDAEAHAAAYRGVLDAAGERPVAFRLFDFGADKPLPGDRGAGATTLGLRGIRLLLQQRELALAQLTALLSAAAGRQSAVEILIPMVADLTDVDATRELLSQAAADLDRRGEARAGSVRLGVMVEVPSAVLLADRLAEAADFISIGTNDLAAYLLAADRARSDLARYHDPLHPAVLAAIRLVKESGAARTIPVSVCGEMAADPWAALVLAGLGIRELSMYPAAFAGVTAMLERFAASQAHELAARCLGLPSVAEVRAAIAEFVDER